VVRAGPPPVAQALVPAGPVLVRRVALLARALARPAVPLAQVPVRLAALLAQALGRLVVLPVPARVLLAARLVLVRRVALLAQVPALLAQVPVPLAQPVPRLVVWALRVLRVLPLRLAPSLLPLATRTSLCLHRPARLRPPPAKAVFASRGTVFSP
jgi:hypothetical protein